MPDWVRLVAGGVALLLSLIALGVFVSDWRWAERYGTEDVRLTAKGLVVRETLRCAKIALLCLAAWLVYTRDLSDEWTALQAHLDAVQTLVLLLCIAATLNEFYMRYRLIQEKRAGGYDATQEGHQRQDRLGEH